MECFAIPEGVAEERYPSTEWLLALTDTAGDDEIVAAVGFVQPGKKGVTPQDGIPKFPGTQREICWSRSTSPRPASPFVTPNCRLLQLEDKIYERWGDTPW